MKKKVFLFAVAALALAACSNDETVSVTQSEAISFRPQMTNVTRSADETQSTLQANGFYVTAKYSTTADNVSGDDYFDNAHYVYNTSTSSYTCADKYYWPSTGYLNFYAYAPAADGTLISRTNYKTFVIKPDQTASTNAQKDFVYTCTMNQTKAVNSTGVTLQFHHAQSKVSLYVKNSSATMDFTINGNIQLCNVYRQGTFTYTGVTSNRLKSTDWNTQTDAGNYVQAQLASSFAANASAAKVINDLILVPQSITSASAYSGTTEGATITTGSYILIPIIAKQKDTEIVIYSGNAIWPLPAVAWVPGMHYTYTVDLAGGGYKESNSDDGDADLDPVLEGSEIIFTTVDVDAWDATSYIVGNMVFAANTGGAAYAANIADGAGVYTITVNGFTASESVSVSGTNCDVTPDSGTAGANGTFTVTCTVGANAGSSTKAVTVTVNGATHSATINLTQAAPAP